MQVEYTANNHRLVTGFPRALLLMCTSVVQICHGRGLKVATL